jgi:hypothetical protein
VFVLFYESNSTFETMMLNEYVAESDYKLLSLIFTDIGNVPICSGFFKGAIIKFGKVPVTKEDDYPRFILTNLAVSFLSRSIIVGNLNNLVFPNSRLMSLKKGKNSGGPVLGTITI